MRANISFKRNWKSYFSSIKRFDWSFLIITLIALELISIFIALQTNEIIWYILFSLNSLAILYINWKVLLGTIAFIFIYFIVLFCISNTNNINNKIDVNTIVTKRINSGIITNYNNSKIYIKTFENLDIDDLINLKSDDVKTISFDSSFNKYLKSLGVKYIANNATVKFLGTKKSLRRTVYDYFIRGPAYYTRYVPLVLLGIKNNKNEEIVNKIKNISIVHLFTISGFHINILLFIIRKLLKSCKIENKYLIILICFLIFPYIMIMGMPVSALRAFTFSILCLTNKYFFNNRFKRIDILASIMILIFVINPFMVFSYSFIFSFLMSYVIEILIMDQGKKYKKLKFLIVTWLFSSLINIVMNNEMNFSSFISNIFFSPIIAFSYIATFLFFWIKPLMNSYYLLVDLLINLFQFLKLSFEIEINTTIIILINLTLFITLLIYVKKPWKNNLSNQLQ